MRATDKDTACSQCYGCEGIRAVGNATVEVHLAVLGNRCDNIGEQLHRNRRTIQLASAVVGQDDRVDAGGRQFLGCGDGLDPLDDEFPGPPVSKP